KAAFDIINTDRATGTMLSYEISSKYKKDALPKGSLAFIFRGCAGQRLAAFAAPGFRLAVSGEPHDYCGTGLSGGELVIYPDSTSKFAASENIIIGNVALYGATNGHAYINGLAGERFAVRNSGAVAVVEGVGDHGCEYMTGGIVAILGETGRNFAAGMSGGMAYIFDEKQEFESNCNVASVDLDPLDADDIQILQQLVTDHHKNTNSSKAAEILGNWERSISKFIKVMPKEYKAVLAKKKSQQ